MNHNEIDPNDYKNRCIKYPREHYLHEHWYPIFENAVKKYCKKGKILDLGCGFGSSTEIVRKFNQNTIGIDIAYDWLKYSKKNQIQIMKLF